MQGLLNQGKFVPSQKVLALRNKLINFMEEHIYPMENEFYKLAQSESRWTVHPAEEKLKEIAKKEGLWNLWIPVCILILLLCSIFYLYFVISEAFIFFQSGFDILKLPPDYLATGTHLFVMDFGNWYTRVFTILISKFTLLYTTYFIISNKINTP